MKKIHEVINPTAHGQGGADSAKTTIFIVHINHIKLYFVVQLSC